MLQHLSPFLENSSVFAAAFLLGVASAITYMYVSSESTLTLEPITTVATTSLVATPSVQEVFTQTDAISTCAQLTQIGEATTGDEAIAIANKIVSPVSFKSQYYLLVDSFEHYTNYLMESYDLHSSILLMHVYASFHLFQEEFCSCMENVTMPQVLPLIFAKVVTNSLSEDLISFKSSLHDLFAYAIHRTIIDVLINKKVSLNEIKSLFESIDSVTPTQRTQISEILISKSLDILRCLRL